jgi:VanZ family protein
MSRNLPAGLRAVPMLMVMGAIFLLSEQTGDTLCLPPVPGIDKLGHAIVYGILAASTILAFSVRYKETNPAMVMQGTTLFCLFYGLSDEFHQSFVPGRSPSGFDVLADVCGALCVCFLWRSYSR